MNPLEAILQGLGKGGNVGNAPLAGAQVGNPDDLSSINFAQLAPMLQMIMAGLGAGASPMSRPGALPSNLGGGQIPQVQLPQTNPASLRR